MIPPRPTILHLTGMHSTKFGSMERYLAETVLGCRARGYGSILQYERQPLSHRYLELLSELGAAVITVSTASPTRSTKIRIARVLASARASIVHTHFSNAHVIGMAGAFGRMAGATRIISSVHNLIERPSGDRTHRAYNRCDAILAVSEAVEKKLLATGVLPSLVATHYLGLFGPRNPDSGMRRQLRREFNIPEDAVVLANIGFDAAFKGVDRLLGIMANLHHKCPNLYLLQVGIDAECSTWPDKAVAMGLNNRIKWAGIRDSGWRLLNAADVYVQPSRSGEGLPFAIMEAMSMRLPVVATRVSGNEEAVVDEQTGYLAPNTSEGLTRALLRMIRNRGQWPAFGNAGYRRYRHLFDGDASVRKLIEDHYQIS